MRTNNTAILAFTFASIVPLTLASAAWPCSPAIPSLDGEAAPDDGGALPVNGVIHAEIFTFGALPSATLRADGAEQESAVDVDNVGDLVRFNVQGLVPSTSYTLSLTLGKDVAFTEEDLARDIHFVTTPGVDETAPTIDGEARVVVTHQMGPTIFSDFTCGSGAETNTITITPPDPVDDVALAGIKLFRVDDSGARELRRFVLGSGQIVDSEPVAGDYAYELVAVDMAGNESAPLDVDVSVSGCSATGASTHGVLALTAALALLARRRKLAAR